MMRLTVRFTAVTSALVLTGCAQKGLNPIDPYESFNRKVHNFNMAFDATFLKPPTKLYVAVVPGIVRKGVNNAFNNLDLLPTIANDLLQAKGIWAIKDSWRFAINSTLGVGGLFDVAVKFSLPPHYNDLGLTLAKWGDKNSPYLVLPLLGPSTFRDGTGWVFQFALWSPYVYVHNDGLAYGLIALRAIDLRSQLFDAERLMGEALDKYSFIRDAYLQHRNYLITGAQDSASASAEDLPGDQEAAAVDYVDE
jgi:phospholipid-binding lipoprotein MlaA